MNWYKHHHVTNVKLASVSQVSTGLGAGIPEQRAKNEWIEGVAIWVAVFLVSGVGESAVHAFPYLQPFLIDIICRRWQRLRKR